MQPGYVYKATSFVFDNGNTPKPKYFVVFHKDAESMLLLSLTTSQQKLPADLDSPDSEGCVYFNDTRGYGHAFVWKPNRPVGTNGFCFPLRTYVQFQIRADLYTLTEDQLNAKITHRVVECCRLSKEEFEAILRCLLASKFLIGKLRRELQAIVDTL